MINPPVEFHRRVFNSPLRVLLLQKWPLDYHSSGILGQKIRFYCWSVACPACLRYNEPEVIIMYEIDKKKFGAFVARLRKEKGYTQKELAQRLFISDKAVSKWETAVSIPDIALLIPLAELLGVSVMELLMCQRRAENAMDADQVEQIIKTAISFSDDAPQRGYQTKGKWAVIYAVSLAAAAIGLLLNHLDTHITQMSLTAVILGAVFGAYFCFFVRIRLPAYYDEDRISGMIDGVFRMNVPGLVFNNSNWPHIVRVGRIWSCAAMALYPLLSFLMTILNVQLWITIELGVFLTLILGGLFIPIYMVGRKYEERDRLWTSTGGFSIKCPRVC